MKKTDKIEAEKRQLDREIDSLQHEKTNLLVQIQVLQNRLNSDESSSEMKVEETIQLESSRNVNPNYRRLFERNFFSNVSNEENVEIFNESQNLIEQIDKLSLDQTDFLSSVRRTVTKLNQVLDEHNKIVSFRSCSIEEN